MVYMGSKSRYAKYLVPILQKTIDENNVDTYIECFVGGGNIVDKIKCKNRFGYDRNDTLIALLKQAAEDFDKVLKEENKEIWEIGKAYKKDGVQPPENISLADIGAMEFFASYSAGGFRKSYANHHIRDGKYVVPFDERYRNLQKQAPALKGITFECQNYWELEPVKNAVIYLDPPYKNTEAYEYARQGRMNYDKFWNWVREISKNNYVFISEQVAPDDFEAVWEKEGRMIIGKDNNHKTTEKLFRYKDGLK